VPHHLTHSIKSSLGRDQTSHFRDGLLYSGRCNSVLKPAQDSIELLLHLMVLKFVNMLMQGHQSLQVLHLFVRNDRFGLRVSSPLSSCRASSTRRWIGAISREGLRLRSRMRRWCWRYSDPEKGTPKNWIVTQIAMTTSQIRKTSILFFRKNPIPAFIALIGPSPSTTRA